MNGFRKSLIAFVVVTLAFLVFPLKAWAHRVSAAGGCSIPNVHPDTRGFYNTIKSFPEWMGRYYAEDYYCITRQYKRWDLHGRNNYYIDSSDIHYLVGHGATRWDPYYHKDLTAIIFEDGNSLPARHYGNHL